MLALDADRMRADLKSEFGVDIDPKNFNLEEEMAKAEHLAEKEGKAPPQ